MNTLLWIVFGGLAGWIATMLTGSDPAFGTIGNIVIGIVGAFIGGWIADKMGSSPGVEHPASVSGFFWAVVGAVVLLFLANLLL